MTVKTKDLITMVGKFGVKEWADHTKNIFKGCQNDCKYCYARKNAKRWNRISSDDEWKDMKLNKSQFFMKEHFKQGRIMFPTTHDTFPENLKEIKKKLLDLLRAGNDVLYVSKPRFDCIKEICDTFMDYADKLEMRFTITSSNNKYIRFWEPNAPLFEERINALRYALEKGYTVSVSIEPLLDKNIFGILKEVYYTNAHSIWIGLMNHVQFWGKYDHFNTMQSEMHTNEWVQELFDSVMEMDVKGIIRWKDSIQKRLGIDYLGNKQ